MKRNSLHLGVSLVFGLLTPAFALASSRSAIPGDAEIRKVLAERLEGQRPGIGIVVGIVEPAGRRIVARGTLEGGPATFDGRTIFEIGSATKVFTSLVLADMVRRGEVALADPVSNYLPEGVAMPERDGRRITLADLATHTSGLPRLPSNLASKDPANPYADYSVRQLYEFLSGYRLSRETGSQYEYSNLGAGLLGHALARRAGEDYETLVRTRICKPLGMNDTAVTLSDAMKGRLVVGHDESQNPVAGWDLPTLAGAGALRSSANDLLTLLAAHLGYEKTALTPAMSLMLATRRPTGTPSTEIALGWHVTKAGDTEVAWHNGGTGGYRSWLGFDARNRAGVVVLANMFTTSGVDDIGQRLLVTGAGVAEPPKTPPGPVIDPAVFDRYVGTYELKPTFHLTVTREGSRFFIQATGQPRFEMFPRSETEFVLRAVNAAITFEVDGSGRATGLVLHQAGDHRAARLPG
jgi:D-alanyl-D-alanine-carboxypeptidase/D-alanyl-D-alanine-endopeptidase